MHLRLSSVLLAAVLSLPPALALPAAASAQPSVVLRPGDVLRITVWREPDLSGEVEIAPDSTLRHPLYNELRMAGIPAADAEARIREFLRSRLNDPRVSVEPLIRVSVGGDVRSPNTYRLPASTTVGDAIAAAGGGSADANLQKVALERGGERRTLDLTRMGGAADEPILSGDRLSVPRRRHLFRDVVGPMASVAASLSGIVLLILN